MTPEMQLERAKLFTSVYIAMIQAYAGKPGDTGMHAFAQHEASRAVASFDQVLR